MRKIIFLFTVLTLMCVLCACGKDKSVVKKDEQNKSSEQSQTADFEKPENYATVLFVKINPEFNIYLDVEGNTLAVEPLNDDAKSIVKDFDTTEKGYQKIINNIITSASEKGFIKQDAKISISATENKANEVNIDELLANVNVAATQTVTSLNLEVKIETSNAIQTPSDTSESSNTTKPAETSKQVEQSKPATTNTPTHTHSYTEATCTSPQTCSCGTTTGGALGHNYDEDGVCTRCKVKDPNFTYPTLASMGGQWKYYKTNPDGSLVEAIYQFDQGESIRGGTCIYEECNCIGVCIYAGSLVWNGKKYHPSASGPLAEDGKYEESNGKIIITNGYEGQQMILERISTNSAKVILVEEGFHYGPDIPVGSVFVFAN